MGKEKEGMLTEEIQKKIKNKQGQINTNENLSDYGYITKGKSSNGTIRWVLEEWRKKYNKQYYVNHKLELDANNILYYKTHREEILKQNKIYCSEHEEEFFQRNKNYYREHKKEIIEQVKLYGHTEKGKLIRKQQNHERRGRGFNPLNGLIEGIECDAHHINNDDIIYMPAIIHQKIPHNLKTYRNMDLINSIAEGFK